MSILGATFCPSHPFYGSFRNDPFRPKDNEQFIVTFNGETKKGAFHTPTLKVKEFCKQKGIIDYLDTAIRLAQASFPAMSGFDFDLEQDPETGDEWVVYRVVTSGNVGQILAERRCFSAKWVDLVPWPKRHLIRLSCQVA